MSIMPQDPDHKTTPPPELLHAAREWIFRHSSQPDGDRWTDNPDHLDWAAENLLVDLAPWLDQMRATAVRQANHNGRKTHCPQGHPYDDGNVYVTPAGRRQCRECNRQRQRERYEAERPASAEACWCAHCEGSVLAHKHPNDVIAQMSGRRFITCRDCGDKRCPRAAHHDRACARG